VDEKSSQSKEDKFSRTQYSRLPEIVHRQAAMATKKYLDRK